MASRKKSPLRLHAEDNPGRHSDIPPCPGHLDREAKKEWRRVSKELAAEGLLSHLDRAALAAYCLAWSRWVRLEEIILKTGEVLTRTELAADGEVRTIRYPNPYCAPAAQALKQLHTFLGELGLSPAARSRIKRPVPAGGAGAPDLLAFLEDSG